MSALELVCLYMTDANSGPWLPKDLRTITSLQATCKEARTIRHGFIEERKSVAIRDGFIEDRKSVDKAHKANMRKLKKHIGGYIYLAREQSIEDDEEYFVHPFTGEFDYTDSRGAWYDDDRVKYGDNPLTSDEMEERDRMMRDKPLPFSMSLQVHHGLLANCPWTFPQYDT
jgi:hypothetical protein